MSLPFFHILSSGKNIFIISFLEEMISHQETRTIQMSIYILDSLSLQKKKMEGDLQSKNIWQDIVTILMYLFDDIVCLFGWGTIFINILFHYF